MVTSWRASAALGLVLAGGETLALGALVDGGCVTVALSLRATASAAPAAGRARVRRGELVLQVEPRLPAPDDEGDLATEGHVLRARGAAADLSVSAPELPDLASFEARALAADAALAAATGGIASPEVALRAAARAGSPLVAFSRGAHASAVAATVTSLAGDETTRLDEPPPWCAHLLLARDRHAPPGPGAAATVAAWRAGDRAPLLDAARAARAAARAVASGRAGALGALIADEARALARVVPLAERDRLVEDALLDAGAGAVRRQGDSGLLVLWVDPARRASVLARADDLGLERIEATASRGGITVEAVA